MKTAIVTGASSGIGLEISKTLLSHGFKVYGFGRDFKSVSLQNELFLPIICDIMNICELTAKIKDIKHQNDIHILVNNAGIGYFGPHEELNPRKIHEMVQTNLEVPLIMAQLLLRDIKKNKGMIFNISSITAKKSNTYGCAYGATKAGISSFSNSLFDEVRKYGVKVIAIHPDMTKSNFYRNTNFCEGDDEDTYLLPSEVAGIVDLALSNRDGMVITEITLQPQRHQIKKNNKGELQ